MESTVFVAVRFKCDIGIGYSARSVDVVHRIQPRYEAAIGIDFVGQLARIETGIRICLDWLLLNDIRRFGYLEYINNLQPYRSFACLQKLQCYITVWSLKILSKRKNSIS